MTMTSLISQYAASRRGDSFSRKDLHAWILSQNGYDGDIQASLTKNLRQMSGDGRLVKVSRGQYAAPDTGFSTFLCRPDDTAKSLYTSIKAGFPYTESCVWNPSCLIPYMLHVPNLDMYIVEIERMAMEPLLSDLSRSYPDRRVLLKPREEEYLRYGSGYPCIIVKPLVTQAPLSLEDGVSVPAIEKILVDIVAGDSALAFAGGSETYNIYSEVLKRFRVNLKALHRYASRRSVDTEVTSILENITHDTER